MVTITPESIYMEEEFGLKKQYTTQYYTIYIYIYIYNIYIYMLYTYPYIYIYIYIYYIYIYIKYLTLLTYIFLQVPIYNEEVQCMLRTSCSQVHELLSWW